MELNEVTQSNIKFVGIAQKHGITVSQIGSREQANERVCQLAARAIMVAAGIPKLFIDSLLDKKSPWHWLSLYDYILVSHAISLAEKVANNDQQCEVGLKAPQFRKHNLLKRYNLSFVGTFEPEWSRDYPKDRKTIYNVYQNPAKTISFSQGDRYGYVGLTFPTLKDAYEFGIWYTTRKSFDCKDINMFFNGLGGLCLSQVKEFNESCNLTQPLTV